MKPLNQPERKKAFLNFLLFFIITVVVVVTVVFFSIQVPFKQNDQLTREIAKVEDERAFLTKFKTKIEETVSMIDSASRITNPILVDDKINANLTQLLGMLHDDSIPVKNLYESMVTNLSDLQGAKMLLRKSSDKDAMVLDYKQQLSDLRTRLNQCEQANDAFRNAAASKH